jgi:hypothetical protein
MNQHGKGRYAFLLQSVRTANTVRFLETKPVAVSKRGSVFWIVTTISVVVEYQTFGGPCCLHLHFILTMEAARSSVTLVNYRNTNRCHNPEHHDFKLHRHGKGKVDLVLN